MIERDSLKSDREASSGCPSGRSGKHPCESARRSTLLASVFLIALGGGALFLFDPVQTRFFPRCLLYALTGLRCPGCGTARAIHAALHCRFWEAFRLNPALPAFLAMIVFGVAFPRLARHPGVTWTVLAFIVIWGVVRNFIGI